MISVNNLTKFYDRTLALDNLTLNVPNRSIFGLLGPNGSGKSTFIKLLMGFIFPDAGTIDVQPIASPSIGYVPERAAFPMQAKIGEYLQVVGQLSNLSGLRLHQKVYQRLEQVGLENAADRPIGACSKGMMQRLALAAALLTDSPLLILDEPMSGLDPKAQYQIRQIIHDAHREGKTILLSTHQLADVKEFCTHIAILNRAKLVRTGQIADVLPFRDCAIIEVRYLPPAIASKIRRVAPEIHIETDTITLTGEAIQKKSVVLRHLINADVELLGFKQQRVSLEDIYLEAIRE